MNRLDATRGTAYAAAATVGDATAARSSKGRKN